MKGNTQMNAPGSIKIWPIFVSGDYCTGIFRISDPLENLKIKVVLKKMTASGLLYDEDNLDPGLKMFVSEKSKDYVEERTFHWQEKVLYPAENGSLHEGQPESDPDSGDAKDQRRHRKSIQLYSYTQDDLDSGNIEIHIPVMASRRDEEYSIWRTKKVRKNNLNDLSLSSSTSTHSSEKFMYIMADIGPPWHKEEALLCVLKVSSQGKVLSVCPDFSTRPYVLKNTHNEVFNYTLENVKEDTSLNEPYPQPKSKTLSFMPSATPFKQEFSPLPPPPLAPFLSILLLGEIVSAHAFDHDNLFVEYLISLPEGWSSPHPDSLKGVTQSCWTKAKGAKDVAYFGHTFEVEITTPYQHLNDLLDANSFPSLLLAAMSQEGWRPQGYGRVMLNMLSPQVASCSTWLPVIHQPSAALTRFFIGGVPSISQLSDVGIPPSALHKDGKLASKLGQTVQSSGIIQVRTSLVFYGGESILETESYTRLPGMDASFSRILRNESMSDPTFASIFKVILAFKQAREKMISARSSIFQSSLLDSKPS